MLSKESRIARTIRGNPMIAQASAAPVQRKGQYDADLRQGRAEEAARPEGEQQHVAK